MVARQVASRMREVVVGCKGDRALQGRAVGDKLRSAGGNRPSPNVYVRIVNRVSPALRGALPFSPLADYAYPGVSVLSCGTYLVGLTMF